MASIKEQLKKELQTITFTEQRKNAIIRHVKNPPRKRAYSPVWQYRIVFAFVILLGFGLALLNGNVGKQTGATQAKGGAATSLSELLAYDSVKVFLLGMAFVIASAGVEIVFLRKNDRFPKCANCGSVWSRTITMKVYLRKKGAPCPHCGTVNFQTRKSLKKTLAFQMLVPFMIVVANMFDNVVLGMCVYLGFLVILSIYVIPALIELQIDNPTDEPLW